MKKMITAALLLAVAFSAVACSGEKSASSGTSTSGGEKPASSSNSTPASQQQSSTEAVMQAALQARCSACHGSDLRGGSGPDLTTLGSRMNKEQIKEVLQKGRGRMPGGLVQEQELEQVAAYLAEQK